MIDDPPPSQPTREPRPVDALNPPPAGATLPVPATESVSSPAEAEVEQPLDDPHAAQRFPCPFCGMMATAALDRCTGCGWKVVPPGAGRSMESLRKDARTIYILQAVSVLCLGFSAIPGLLMAYADRGDARGTWLDSHFDWQVDTFWGAFWMGVATIVATRLGAAFLGVGDWIGLIGSMAALSWYIHRVVKGWTRLSDDDPVTEY
jgi:uncharacterized membrane protein